MLKVIMDNAESIITVYHWRQNTVLVLSYSKGWIRICCFDISFESDKMITIIIFSIMGNEQAKLSPEELRELEDSTYFDKRELQKWFREFMKDCPSGSLSKDDFIRY